MKITIVTLQNKDDEGLYIGAVEGPMSEESRKNCAIKYGIKPNERMFFREVNVPKTIRGLNALLSADDSIEDGTTKHMT